MIRCLCAEFHLAQTLMHIVRRLIDGLGEKLIRHKVGAGAGCKIAAVFYQFHAAQIDLAIAFDRVFYRASGLCKRRRIKDDHVKFLPAFF